MFGILAGLIGRAATGAMARRPMGGAFRGGFGGGGFGGGGLLGGLLQRRARPTASFSTGGGGGQSMPSRQAQQQAPQEQGQEQQQAPPPPAQAQQEQVQPIGADGQPPPPHEPIAEAQPTGNKLATEGLLDETPAYAPPPEPRQEAITPARQVANQTETLNPVAPQEDMAFGATPMPLPPGLEGLLDQDPPRRMFDQTDPNPTKPADTKSQARHGQGGPQYSFQTMGSWTASVPNYSYRR